LVILHTIDLHTNKVTTKKFAEPSNQKGEAHEPHRTPTSVRSA
jgi:hypothetical protein